MKWVVLSHQNCLLAKQISFSGAFGLVLANLYISPPLRSSNSKKGFLILFFPSTSVNLLQRNIIKVEFLKYTIIKEWAEKDTVSVLNHTSIGPANFWPVSLNFKCNFNPYKLLQDAQVMKKHEIKLLISEHRWYLHL